MVIYHGRIRKIITLYKCTNPSIYANKGCINPYYYWRIYDPPLFYMKIMTFDPIACQDPALPENPPPPVTQVVRLRAHISLTIWCGEIFTKNFQGFAISSPETTLKKKKEKPETSARDKRYRSQSLGARFFPCNGLGSYGGPRISGYLTWRYWTWFFAGYLGHFPFRSL